MATKAPRQFDMNLLDKNLDDFENVAGFEVPVNGMYVLLMTAALKVVKEIDSVELSFTVVECIEQNDPEEAPTPVDTKFSLLFMLDKPIAVSNMKKFLAPFAEHFGESNVLKLITDSLNEPVQIAAKVKRRADKTDDEKFYATVSDVTIS